MSRVSKYANSNMASAPPLLEEKENANKFIYQTGMHPLICGIRHRPNPSRYNLKISNHVGPSVRLSNKVQQRRKPCFSAKDYFDLKYGSNGGILTDPICRK